MIHCAQQIIASAIDDVERASGWLAHSEEEICLSSQAMGTRKWIQPGTTYGEVQSASPGGPQGYLEPSRELLDPDRSVRKTPGIAGIGQAVAEYDNAIERRRVLRRRAHACRYRPDQDG
jgi:hypothetical protein